MTNNTIPSGKGAVVAYIRVSTVDQNTARQEEAIQELHPDATFIDHCSGKDTSRPELEKCLRFLRSGDTLVVHSIDRLCRNQFDLLRLVEDFSKRGIVVRFLKEGITTSETDPMSRFLLTILAAVASFERDLIRERQREGIAIAKAAGKYRGGKPKLTAEQKALIVARDKAGVPKAVIARDLGVSRNLIYNALAENEKEKAAA